MVCCQTFAQSGMHISALFEGKIVPMRQMVETRIRGKAISRYKLSYFHSVRFKADEALVKKIDHLAAADFVADSEKRKATRERDFYVHADVRIGTAWFHKPLPLL